MDLLGYGRVSSDEQAATGYGLDDQVRVMRDGAQRRGHSLVDICLDEGASGKDMAREALLEALGRLAAGEADGLLVAKLDRLTRSLLDFIELLDWFARADKALVVLDFDLDTSSPTGRLIAHFIAALAQWERELIGQRTKAGLLSVKLAGKPVNQGSVADRPELLAWISDLRDGGMTLQAICDVLNEDGVPTIRGAGKWRKSALQTVLGYRRKPPRRKPITLPEV